MRQMIWIETARLAAWACSECGWTFSPMGPPRGGSLEEMKQNYESQRDKEFASHNCAEHPRPRSARDDLKFPRQSDDQTYSASSDRRGGRNDIR
jgi:hypothetical protein